jgi:hypothetical protein
VSAELFKPKQSGAVPVTGEAAESKVAATAEQPKAPQAQAPSATSRLLEAKRRAQRK